MKHDYSVDMINQNQNDSATILTSNIINKLDISHVIDSTVTTTMTGTIPDIIRLLEAEIGTKSNEVIVANFSYILVFDKYVIRFRTDGSKSAFISKERSLVIRIIGDMEEIEYVHFSIKNKYGSNSKDQIAWYYKSDGKVSKSWVDLTHPNTVYDAFFPWIKPSVKLFQKDFIDSDANVLVLIGDPGTGKTSFIRDMINNNDLSCAITYDEELMGMDSFFSEFMTSTIDLLVTEDSDVLLRDRQVGNKVMNKLLNASDGLVKTNKKIVLTANLTSVDEIDPALIRPGRCYDVLRFRELTYKEAQAAAAAAGLAEPEDGCTLSQLFAKGPDVSTSSKFGFNR